MRSNYRRAASRSDSRVDVRRLCKRRVDARVAERLVVDVDRDNFGARPRAGNKHGTGAGTATDVNRASHRLACGEMKGDRARESIGVGPEEDGVALGSGICRMENAVARVTRGSSNAASPSSRNAPSPATADQVGGNARRATALQEQSSQSATSIVGGASSRMVAGWGGREAIAASRAHANAKPLVPRRRVGKSSGRQPEQMRLQAVNGRE